MIKYLMADLPVVAIGLSMLSTIGFVMWYAIATQEDRTRQADEFIRCVKNGGVVTEVPYRGRMCIERNQ